MRRTALLLVLATTGCASSDWAKTESVPGGKLYVPKLYAPLLPGSMYPDKKVQIPAKARPAMVLVCPSKGDCRQREVLDHAAQRGLVVLVGREPNTDLLRTRAEADPERIGWLLVWPDEAFLRRWIRAGAPGTATAIVGPPRFPSYPSKHLLFAALLGMEPLEAGDGIVLKLYSPNQNGLLPGEAFRDAVEWLAGELGAR
ncbi:MAG: hypothetical protein IPL89_13355 [Acidobacteria bacterium]|nr:hypothetical protein [Acidobacteriota bacterium]